MYTPNKRWNVAEYIFLNAYVNYKTQFDLRAQTVWERLSNCEPIYTKFVM